MRSADLKHTESKSKQSWFKRRNGTWREVSGGCLHNEIVAQFPELQPLVDIHLADEDKYEASAAKSLLNEMETAK